MKKIGLFLDAGLVDSIDTCTVEKYMREKFLVEECPSLEGCIYKMNDGAAVVVLPKSNLNCETVERIILKKNEQAQIIDEQREEIESLKDRLSRSETLRREALDTVNKLRSEFVDLIQQATPRGRTLDSTRCRGNSTSNSEWVPRTTRGVVTTTTKAVPKLWLTSLRK